MGKWQWLRDQHRSSGIHAPARNCGCLSIEKGRPPSRKMVYAHSAWRTWHSKYCSLSQKDRWIIILLHLLSLPHQLLFLLKHFRHSCHLMKHRNIFFLTIIINKMNNTFWVVWYPIHIQISISLGKSFVEIRFRTMLALQEVIVFLILYNLQLPFPLFFLSHYLITETGCMVEKLKFWISLLVSLKCHFTWTLSTSLYL